MLLGEEEEEEEDKVDPNEDRAEAFNRI